MDVVCIFNLFELLSHLRAAKLSVDYSNYSSDLSTRERYSLLRRCLILESYSETKESGFLFTLMLASSSRRTFQLNELDLPSEHCVSCQALMSFVPSAPWSSICETCQLENQRCCYTYEIADFTRQSRLMSTRKFESRQYQPNYQLRYCPLCEIACFNIPEERYADYADFLRDSMDPTPRPYRYFDWLCDIEYCQRCPYCTLSLCPL